MLIIKTPSASFYDLSTNAQSERFHGTLKSTLGNMVSVDQRGWYVVLLVAMMAFRETVYDGTGFSPNFLTLGREIRAPIGVVLGCRFRKAICIASQRSSRSSKA